jgi:hypothetical protein
MERETLRFAAYLDEAGEDPERGCQTLNETGIFYAALRHVWTGNICGISDIGHQRLMKIISNHDITIIMVASELGKVDSQQLSKISDDQIDRVISICRYYHAPLLRVFAGEENPNTKEEEINAWMQRVGTRCMHNNIVPLLEIAPKAQIYRPSDVAQLLANNKQWKLLYDPAALILKQNIDPFIRYWTLLKQYTEAIDVRDLKIGKGFKPPGFGDARIDLTLADAIGSRFPGWFILEPSLGRKHGSAVTKSDTFKNALEGFDHILKDL